MDNLLIREAVNGDASFFFATWLNGYRRSEFAKRIPPKVYFSTHHLVVEGILRRSKCLVACDRDDASSIFGYLVYEVPQTIHHVYVKRVFRGHGIARALLAEAGFNPHICTFTHLFPDTDRLLGKYPGASYNPYVI